MEICVLAGVHFVTVWCVCTSVPVFVYECEYINLNARRIIQYYLHGMSIYNKFAYITKRDYRETNIYQPSSVHCTLQSVGILK